MSNFVYEINVFLFYIAVIFFSDKKSEIVLVSVSANIVSKYTSFVGVDRDSKVPLPQPVSTDHKINNSNITSFFRWWPSW